MTELDVDSYEGIRSRSCGSLRELEELSDRWRSLWSVSPTATVFQRPEWLIAWWRHFGGGTLRSASLHAGERLVGLVPLFLYVDPVTRIRQLTLLGNGISDHLGVLAHPLAVSEIISALQTAAATEPGLDLCDFRDQPADSLLLSANPPQGFERQLSSEPPCPTLVLPDAPEKLGEVVPANLLKKLDYAVGRAAREGAVRFRTSSAGSVDADLRLLSRLHRARWGERGGPGVMDDGIAESFHREVAARLAGAGMLRLHVLSVGDRQAAVFYGFHANHRTSYYLGGFDPAMKIFSPGSLMLRHAIETAIAEGAREFDFLRGAEPYKYDWGATDRAQFRILWRARPRA